MAVATRKGRERDSPTYKQARQAEISQAELEALAASQEVIKPQIGPQTLFLQSTCDIAIYGGAAGGGKSYACLLEPLYHIDNPDFEAVIFRRTYPQITSPGGLWERSLEIYPQVGGKPNHGHMTWTFPSGARVRFSHMQHEQDVLSWKGSEIPLIQFDELTDFSEYQFFYMLSRNRSLCGVKPYVRGYTNPDSESWVKHLLAPWVDPGWPEEAAKRGYPDPRPAKSGEVRYFTRFNGILEWVTPDTPMAKSITFVAATIADNKILMEKDPAYLANLNALPELERQQLLLGNWTIRPSGHKFHREWFPILASPLDDIITTVRFWDLAATEVQEDAAIGTNKANLKDGPDYTAGVKVGMTTRNTFMVLHAIWARKSPLGIQRLVRETAEADGAGVQIWMEEEGGSGGPNTIDLYRREVLPDFDFHRLKQTKNKIIRANITASHAEMRNISLLRGWWNEGFLNFLMAFPNPRIHDDPPDAFFSAMMVLISQAGIFPAVVTGSREREQGLPNERTYMPAKDEMTPEQRDQLLQRQAAVARFLSQFRDIPVAGGEYAESRNPPDKPGGDWI